MSQNINTYTCVACRYAFQSSTLPDSCPDCGKMQYLGKPAVRLATEEEVVEFKKNREIAKNEKW